MSREAVATALDEAAEALARAAHALRGLEPSAARADVQDRVPSRPAAAEAGVPPAPASAFTSCPKHGEPFKPSKTEGWPAYCSKRSDDPAWANDRGYCRINSKNAGEYLAVHKAAPQMDSDEGLPF